MFGNDVYAKIKSVEVKENYSLCKISTSKKNKTNNTYETDFVDKVRFVGDAHKQRPLEGQRIKITSCAVSNCYTKDNKLEFLNKPNYVIFKYELQEENEQSTRPKFDLVIDDNQLPF